LPPVPSEHIWPRASQPGCYQRATVHSDRVAGTNCLTGFSLGDLKFRE
jgi:hypothetical protein